jgi:tight adherence protein B
MNETLALAAAAGLLLVSGVALLTAFIVARKSRLSLGRRVRLASGSLTPVDPGTIMKVPTVASVSRSGTGVRRLFSIGTPHQWGMRANAFVLILIALAASIAIWLMLRTALHFNILIAAPAALAAFFLAPRAFLQKQQRGSEQKFMVLFPDAIDMVIRMVRAGLPITAAARTIALEAPAPVSIVFRTLADRVDIGVPFEDALTKAGEEVGLPDFRFFCVAISLQRATGGNLVATLEIMAEIIRKRRTVRLRAQAMTGEIRMSAYILAGLPFLVTGAMLVVSPGYMTPLITDPRGNVIVGMAILGLVLAYLSMRHMLKSVTMA